MVLWTLRFDRSIHVRFINVEMPFRFECRMGSQAITNLFIKGFTFYGGL
jgi:hypothetical protein